MAWTRKDMPSARFAAKDLLEVEKPSVIDAIRADTQNPQQSEPKTEGAKNRTVEER